MVFNLQICLNNPRRIARKQFADVVRRVEALQARMSETERQVEGLFASLLQEAFGG